MTVSVQISVNGNYKLPVIIKQGERDETMVISGRGHDGPNVQQIYFSHGPDVLTLAMGPEEQDLGETADATPADQAPTE
ncbi:hypothetical protein QH494_16005 [Sphingomonas sp. AR_OL41]|uniref:hypothetical protein n=1 Tax=Sphingomonas sp. AR_OL41 TaxID=3042729 RepID=UPI00248097A3|nr:hypothetical protein [Sphingomonas sp. AR_OL41]MDH7973696.1 hypothetical protein [Sphingomonas sp. AR_OL41]